MELSPRLVSNLRQAYVPILGILVAGSTYGLTISRPIVQSNTWHFTYAETLQFPYPLAATYFQILSACIVLHLPLCFNHVSNFFFHAGYMPLKGTKSASTRRWQPYTSLDDQIWPSLRNDNPNLSSSRFPALKTFLLALAITADATLTTTILSFAPLELFLLSRALVLPLTLGIQALTTHPLASPPKHPSKPTLKPPPTRPNVLATTILSLGILLAAYRPHLPRLPNLSLLALVSASTAAAWPLLAAQSFQLQPACLGASLHHPGDGDGSKRPPSPGPPWSLALLEIWRLLRHISLLSVVLLLPLLLLSDELGHIMRNVYFLSVFDFWLFLTAAAIFRCIWFVSGLLMVREVGAFGFGAWNVCVSVSMMFCLTYESPGMRQWVGLGACLGGAGWWCWWVGERWGGDVGSCRERANSSRRGGGKRSLLLGGVLLIGGLASIAWFSTISIGEGFRAVSGGNKQSISGVHDSEIEMPMGRDDYLGPRPQADSIANVTMLVEKCRGTYEGMENMRNVQGCLEFLAAKQDLYLYQLTRVGSTEGGVEHLANVSDISSQLDTCLGPTLLYHLWWTGLPTWRTELCIKSYLYTQNLPCSRLWIWVNTDANPLALSEWLSHPAFQRFQPLISSGLIVLKPWTLPSRVPLPPSTERDPLDLGRYYDRPRTANKAGEEMVADSVVRDAEGREWLELYRDGEGTQLTFPDFTVAVSDAARLIILHLHGGVYLDLDIILLRDLRPLALSGQGFAERWGSFREQGLYNNALVYLEANSSLSSYLLLAGARMGGCWHFRALGRALVGEGRDDVFVVEGHGEGERGLVKFETGFFDPTWAENDHFREGKCTVPCLTVFESIFAADVVENEWESLEGEVEGGGNASRTLQNFYRGAWAYHIHNQWHAKYQRGSWVDIICRAHDFFFQGIRSNAYGEYWAQSPLKLYGD